MAPRTRSQTGSMPKKAAPISDPSTTSGTTSRIGRTAVAQAPKRKKQNKRQNPPAETKPSPPKPPPQPSPSKPLPRVGLSETALEFPLAADAPSGQPRIFYGEDAPFPRWRTKLDKRPLGEDLEKDLIRTYPGKTHIPGLAPGSHPRANDYTIGLGCVKWDFEPGSSAGWGTLTGHELYMYACARLREALDDPLSRWQLRDAIRKGENARYIAHVENPVPPLIRFGGTGVLPPNDPLIERIKANARKGELILKNRPKVLDMKQFERPSLAWRPGEVELDMGEYSRFVERVRNHRFGTFGPPDHQDSTVNPTATLKVKTSAERLFNEGAEAAESTAGGNADRQEQHAEGARDIETKENPSALSGQSAATFQAQRATKDIEERMRKAKRFIKNEQLIFPHRAQAKQRGCGKAANKGPVQELAPGSSRAAKKFAALAGAVSQDPLKLQLPSNEMDEASKYFRMCNDIVDDPEARQKYYPKVEAFRRIRSWAGAVMPADVERDVKTNMSKVPTANRPFLKMKKPQEVPRGVKL
ncbi:hypothetical protein PEBR_21129 [Penicillium brasilianum]|uniref:Uncharacterized protein n=1 Tax=Penicillium brasilianum TaxID=104259 RepID=A0A1S9RLY8_PENBI|nr:hypothetical protein PEBR_21129 [Penicillium brasilianum]